jgi:putative pyruvate formate lyase activating enzyme
MTSLRNNDLVEKSLSRYLKITRGKLPAKFLIAKRIPAKFDSNDSTEYLWQEHARISKEFEKIQAQIEHQLGSKDSTPALEKSFLDLKIEIADRMLSSCHFCARRCGVDRLTENLGYCGCGREMTVSSIFQHFGEEPELVPSGTIFTLGCTMRCKHCQNYSISQWMELGQHYSPSELAVEVQKLHLAGCRNVNLVGGEPTPWLPHWLRTFKNVETNVPIVWNSNSYYSRESAALLDGFVDVYLLDFKYGPCKCAERISDSPKYWETCTFNHLEAKRCGEVIVRILVLPNHLTCCARPVIHWIAENLGRDTRVNLMFQYRPEWKAHEVPELRNRLTRKDMETAIQLVNDAGLLNFIT